MVKEEKKKKVAVCYSGMYRYMLESFKSLKKHALNNVDYDVYIHIWDKIGTTRGWDKPINLETNLNYGEFNNIDNIKELVIENYNTTKHAFLEKSKVLNGKIMNNPERVISMFYKIYMCNELKKKHERYNNFKYDLVIRMRGDIIFKYNINVFNKNNKNILYNHNNNDTHFGDLFIIGNSETVDEYCNFYNEFEDFTKKHWNNRFFNIEHVQKVWLDEKNIYGEYIFKNEVEEDRKLEQIELYELKR